VAAKTLERLGATEFQRIRFATYDSMGQVTHPSAVVFPEPWNGYRYWMALTPYPFSDARHENPSLYVSRTGRVWSVPDGVTNPLERSANGYLSDPSLVYDPDADALRLYYREVVRMVDQGHSKVHVSDDVVMTASTDGVQWGDPQTLVSDSGRYVVSPSVVRRAAGDWSMWQVDAGANGCDARATRVVRRGSTDGVIWSVAVPVRLAQPGYTVWHVGVRFVEARHEYWALFAAFPKGSDCNRTSLFLATSADGVTWTTFGTPVLAPGAVPQFDANVYQSSFHVDATGGEMTIWLTGARTVSPATEKSEATLEWSAALMKTTTQALFARLGDANPGYVPPEFEREREPQIPMADIII
jgi:hypothetical protein